MSDVLQQISKFFDRSTWINQTAVPFQKAVNRLFQRGGAVGQKVADFLNGTWLGHPLHPVLTDIPVGAWTAAVTLDVVESGTGSRGVGQAADVAVALGIAGAAGSAVTGLADWQHTVGESRRTGFTHAVLNTVALGLFIGSFAARKSGSRGLGKALALTGYGIVGFSAYLGGDLVFRQKIGVNHAPEDVSTEAFIPVLDESLLPENQLTVARMADTPLVLLRRAGRVYALAETCAHLGGPLADGQLEEGEHGGPAVRCPWHGSLFDMDSGDVLAGPSAYPQPCFEARIANGQVEVRRNIQQV